MTRGRTRTGTLPAKADDRLPPPGTVLTRKYKGGSVQVKVLAQGFEYDGQVYGLLAPPCAKAVTGSHCNGFLFFGLTKARQVMTRKAMTTAPRTDDAIGTAGIGGAGAVRDLHPEVLGGGPRAGVQQPRRPARGGRGVRPQPGR